MLGKKRVRIELTQRVRVRGGGYPYHETRSFHPIIDTISLKNIEITR